MRFPSLTPINSQPVCIFDGVMPANRSMWLRMTGGSALFVMRRYHKVGTLREGRVSLTSSSLGNEMRMSHCNDWTVGTTQISPSRRARWKRRKRALASFRGGCLERDRCSDSSSPNARSSNFGLFELATSAKSGKNDCIQACSGKDDGSHAEYPVGIR